MIQPSQTSLDAQRRPSPVPQSDFAHLPVTDAQRNRIKLIVSDVDGTLLNPHHEFTPRTCAALRHVLGKDGEESVRFVIATGKARPATVAIRKALDLDSGTKGHPAIHLNGALTYDDAGKVLNNTVLLPTVAKRCMEMVDNNDKLEYGMYTDQLLRMGCPPDSRFHILLRDGYKEVTTYESDHKAAHQQVQDGSVQVNKILVMGEQADLEQFSDELHKDPILSVHCPPIAPLGSPHCNFTLTQAVQFIKELTPPITKGHGVAALMKHYNLEPDQVLVFGDGDNDIEMLSIPGVWSCCMANGMPGAKKAAKFVWPRGNSEDALAECLEFIFGFGKFNISSSE